MPRKVICERGSSMQMVLRVIIGLLGVLFIAIGFGFLTNPVLMGTNFGLSANGPQGLASLRGDMTAFFWMSGGAFLVGAWYKNGLLLHITAILMAIVFSARALSAALDGTYDGWYEPMVIEAVTVIIALIGAKMFTQETNASQ